jgi:hypothetical protein
MFCFEVGKIAVEMHPMLKQDFGDNSLGQIQI